MIEAHHPFSGKSVNAVEAARFQGRTSQQDPQFQPGNYEGNNDMRANGTYERRNVAGRRNNNCADAKIARRKFIAAEVARLPVADVMEITGMTETAVHNVRRGKNALNHDNLCALLEARPDFTARFFCSVGGELLVRPDQVVALQQAINSVMRGET